MASPNQIARSLEFTAPMLYAQIVRDLAIQEADQLGHRVEMLKQQLETLTIRYQDAREVAAIASQTFAHKYPDGKDAPITPWQTLTHCNPDGDATVTLTETFHARKNGIPQTDKQSNFGQY